MASCSALSRGSSAKLFTANNLSVIIYPSANAVKMITCGMVALLEQFLGRYVALSKDELELVSGMLEVRSCDRKLRLVDIGEQEMFINFVTSGLLRKYFVNGHDEIVKSLVQEGQFISSYVSFFNRTPSEYIIETIEPSTLVAISYDHLQQLFQLDPKWERAVRLMMTDLLLEKENWLLDNYRFTPRERFLRFMQSRPELLQRVPQKYLASYLQMKPETFSRLKHLVC